MSFKKKNILASYLSHWSKITPKFFKKIILIIGLVLLLLFLFICFEIYFPVNPTSHATITYTAEKGWSDVQIAKDLQRLGVIRSNFFFRFYLVVSLQHSQLQAGKYNLSPRMSAYQVAKTMTHGETIKDILTIPEGWDTRDIGKYLESKGYCTKDQFLQSASKDYSNEFDFLKDLPRGKAGKPDVSLEGYLFPDTYKVSGVESCDDIVLMMLENFDKKLTSDIRAQIVKENKSIFDIVTMASLLEKEVKSLKDKEIVSGILWKRISIGMPLQLDATINYITDGNDPSVAIKDTKIDSPYNTYMYKGLPKGPISNPGIDSIAAAINPIKTAYWFYLSDGQTIFSKTAEEHAANKAKYLH